MLQASRGRIARGRIRSSIGRGRRRVERCDVRRAAVRFGRRRGRRASRAIAKLGHDFYSIIVHVGGGRTRGSRHIRRGLSGVPRRVDKKMPGVRTVGILGLSSGYVVEIHGRERRPRVDSDKGGVRSEGAGGIGGGLHGSRRTFQGEGRGGHSAHGVEFEQYEMRRGDDVDALFCGERFRPQDHDRQSYRPGLSSGRVLRHAREGRRGREGRTERRGIRRIERTERRIRGNTRRPRHFPESVPDRMEGRRVVGHSIGGGMHVRGGLLSEFHGVGRETDAQPRQGVGVGGGFRRQLRRGRVRMEKERDVGHGRGRGHSRPQASRILRSQSVDGRGHRFHGRLRDTLLR
mmetsp:Transcript_41230/g.124644  ORF Transcript_41230/g.124644 Transcript_41230/m.124644 type:complete len:347 (-) Transcript_41230:1148-2188(-)